LALKEYYVYENGKFGLMSSREILSKQSPSIRIWSARLSTGIFGLTTCYAGNRGPKNTTEVILGVGNDGLEKIIDLGFLACPVCKPYKTPGFWDAARDSLKKLGILSINELMDRNKLPYDSRRVNWEQIFPLVGGTPGRLYVPKGLNRKEIKSLNDRIVTLGLPVPKVGYYDPDSNIRFNEYTL